MSGTHRIASALSAQPVDDLKELSYFIGRILQPLVRAMLSTVNRLTGTTTTVRSNIILTGEEGLVAVDASAGPVVVTLSSPIALSHQLVVVKTDASGNAVTIAPPSGVTVNGAASVALSSQWSAAILIADDSQFYDLTAAASPVSRAFQVQYGADADTQALSNVILRMPTVTAARKVLLPVAPAEGTFLELVVDNASEFFITIDGGTKNIDDGGFNVLGTTYVVANRGASYELVYFATPNLWRLR